ncbi:MAG: V-type ATP synthase subunit I, partial [Candidatus Sumerlaeota bacterium]
MIVDMKKVTILALDAHRDAATEALRDVGVVHVVPVKPPTGSDIDHASEREVHASQAAGVLRMLTHVPHDVEPADPETGEVQDVIKRVLALDTTVHQLEEENRTLERELNRVAPLGAFDPKTIRDLSEAGIEVRIYSGPDVEAFATPEGLSQKIMGYEGKTVWIAVTGPKASFEDFETPEAFDRESLPEMSPDAMRERIDKNTKKIAEARLELARMRSFIERIEQERDEAKAKRHFLEVREGMGEAERIVYLQGFCPVPDIENLRQAAAKNGWGLVIEDPSDTDDVPTKLVFSKWVRPIKAVFEFLQIQPGYHEADISMVFLLFFSIFFGILIGDAGYGALFLIGTWAARPFMKNAPMYPFVLMTILSSCTIAWGMMTGNYFGITEGIPAPLAQFNIHWLDPENPESNNNIMGLSFLIGALHLTIAHLWNFIVLFPKAKAFEQFGWMCIVWVMYFAACSMVLQREFPMLGFILLGVGLVLVILFMTPVKDLKRDWILHVMLPLDVISAFVDLVSYVRLFAVGIAALSVAQSFNSMAMDLGFNSVLTGLIAALILLLGHALNIVLCALGILVHGVRLNTLEFSMHKGLQWSGKPYDPFSRGDKAL